MNKLSLEKKCKIVQLLVEGNSLRSISRIVDVSINTVTRLLVDAGRACLHFHNDTVIGVEAERIQCDEVWGFVYGRKRNLPDELAEKRGYGEVWLWIAMDPDTKLVVSYYVGNRDVIDAQVFIADLKSRLKRRVQLTTDGLVHYRETIVEVFGYNNIDFAQMVKLYGKERKVDNGFGRSGRYRGCIKTKICGDPDPAFISTSLLERQNLTVRMGNRRYTRNTNAYSKKIQNHIYALALHYAYYNFVRRHHTIRVTPAMRAGLTKRFMKIEDIVTIIDNYRNPVVERSMYYREELMQLQKDIPLFSVQNIYELNKILGRLRRIVVTMNSQERFQGELSGIVRDIMEVGGYIIKARNSKLEDNQRMNYELASAEIIHHINRIIRSLSSMGK